MQSFQYLFVILAITSLSSAVRVNMQGSVKLGKDVLETISHYLQKRVSNRRSGGGEPEEDLQEVVAPEVSEDTEKIRWTVQTASFCKGLKICNGPFGEFVNNYVILLADAIESIFDGILTSTDGEKEGKSAVFVDKLRVLLHQVERVLKDVNDKIRYNKHMIEWISIIKKISKIFQTGAKEFVSEHLIGDPHEIHNVKKKLIQKLIIAVILVENKYERKLCLEHEICEREHECTKALSSLLGEFDTTDNDKAKDFMKFFYENLPNPDETFYFLTPETIHEFQVILSDLSYAKDAPAKEVLLSVYKTVDARLKFLKLNIEMTKAYDQQLVHVILSDMDYFYYSKRKTYPFDTFLGDFTGWMRLGGKFSHHMRQMLNNLRTKLLEQPSDLLEKLSNEVQVFLELTVDPDHSAQQD